MATEKRATGDFLLELEELEKVDVKSESEGTYSFTYDFGAVYTIICC